MVLHQIAIFRHKKLHTIDHIQINMQIIVGNCEFEMFGSINYLIFQVCNILISSTDITIDFLLFRRIIYE